MIEEIRKLAHSKWEKAGKPEGYDLNFWVAAENEIKRNTVYENLKLPICPKCSDTKNVIKMDVLLYAHVTYPWYKCKVCGIKWHAKEGIKEKDDDSPCFG